MNSSGGGYNALTLTVTTPQHRISPLGMKQNQQHHIVPKTRTMCQLTGGRTWWSSRGHTDMSTHYRAEQHSGIFVSMFFNISQTNLFHTYFLSICHCLGCPYGFIFWETEITALLLQITWISPDQVCNEKLFCEHDAESNPGAFSSPVWFFGEVWTQQLEATLGRELKSLDLYWVRWAICMYWDVCSFM